MSTRNVLAFLVAFAIALFAGHASAQAPDAAVRIASARHGVIALQENADAGVITRAQAEEGTRRYLTQAAEAAGHPLTLDELMRTPDPSGAASSPAQLTALQRFAGLITFVNVLWVLGIAVGSLSFAFLFGSYVKDLIKMLVNVPLVVYEAMFYLASLVLMAWGNTLSAGVGPYVGLTGCLFFAGALGFSSRMRKFAADGFRFSAILCVVWTIAALAYGSSLLGFIAVGALLSALGFSILVSPLCYCIGFKDEASVGKATSAAFVMLAIFVGIRALHGFAPRLGIFESGALFLGSFVGYLGLLITSSRWYDGKNRNYVLFQITTVVAGIAALLVGSYLGIGELQKIGGTFFVLYLVEKIIEIPAKSARGYAAVGLVASAAIFGFCMFVKNNPETLRPYVFMFR